jgi:hypothetical protein
VRGRGQLFDVGFASGAGMAAMELRGSEAQRQRAARAGSDSNRGDGVQLRMHGRRLARAVGELGAAGGDDEAEEGSCSRRDHGWDECGQAGQRRGSRPASGAYNVSRKRLEMGPPAWGCCRRPPAETARQRPRAIGRIAQSAIAMMLRACLLLAARNTTQRWSSGAASAPTVAATGTCQRRCALAPASRTALRLERGTSASDVCMSWAR